MVVADASPKLHVAITGAIVTLSGGELVPAPANRLYSYGDERPYYRFQAWLLTQADGIVVPRDVLHGVDGDGVGVSNCGAWADATDPRPISLGRVGTGSALADWFEQGGTSDCASVLDGRRPLSVIRLEQR